MSLRSFRPRPQELLLFARWAFDQGASLHLVGLHLRCAVREEEGSLKEGLRWWHLTPLESFLSNTTKNNLCNRRAISLGCFSLCRWQVFLKNYIFSLYFSFEVTIHFSLSKLAFFHLSLTYLSIYLFSWSELLLNATLWACWGNRYVLNCGGHRMAFLNWFCNIQPPKH